MNVNVSLREWWHDFVEAYHYVLDPHGWWKYHKAVTLAKFAPRPGMYLMGNSIICHPKLEAQIRTLVGSPSEQSLTRLYGTEIYVSEYVVENPPKDGWQDVMVPKMPRLAP